MPTVSQEESMFDLPARGESNIFRSVRTMSRGMSSEEQPRLSLSFDMTAEELLIEVASSTDADDKTSGVSRNGSRVLKFSEIMLSWCRVGDENPQLAVEIRPLQKRFRDAGIELHVAPGKKPWGKTIELLFGELDGSRFIRKASSAGMVLTGFGKVWKNLSYLASGACGVVYLARGPGNAKGAVKMTTMPHSSEELDTHKKTFTEFVNECRALRELQESTHAPRFYGAYTFNGRVNQDPQLCMGIVTEYFEVSLKELREVSPFSELELRPIAKDMLSAIKYMHVKFFAHRDVKIENVMLRSPAGPACLIDYGFSLALSPNVMPRRQAGTPGYLAPELFRRQDWDCRPQDIFGIACTAHNLVSVVPFFSPESDSDSDVMKRAMQANRKGQISFKHIPQGTSPEFKELLHGMLRSDVSKRLTVHEALESPWFGLLPEKLKHIPHLPCSRRWPLQQRAKKRDPVDFRADVAGTASKKDEGGESTPTTASTIASVSDETAGGGHQTSCAASCGTDQHAPNAASLDERIVSCEPQKGGRLYAQPLSFQVDQADSAKGSPIELDVGIQGASIGQRLLQRGRKLFARHAKTVGDQKGSGERANTAGWRALAPQSPSLPKSMDHRNPFPRLSDEDSPETDSPDESPQITQSPVRGQRAIFRLPSMLKVRVEQNRTSEVSEESLTRSPLSDHMPSQPVDLPRRKSRTFSHRAHALHGMEVPSDFLTALSSRSPPTSPRVSD